MEQAAGTTTARAVSNGQKVARDDYADMLNWHVSGSWPQAGDTVHLSARRGDFEGDGTVVAGVDEDPTRMRVRVADGSMLDLDYKKYRVSVTHTTAREKVAALSEAELFVAHELLLELSVVYADERLGAVAHEIAGRIAKAAGFDTSLD